MLKCVQLINLEVFFCLVLVFFARLFDLNAHRTNTITVPAVSALISPNTFALSLGNFSEYSSNLQNMILVSLCDYKKKNWCPYNVFSSYLEHKKIVIYHNKFRT